MMNDFSRATLVKTIEESWLRLWLIFHRLPKASLHKQKNLIWFMTGLPDSLLNAVLYAQILPDEIDAVLKSLKSQFDAQKTPFSWYIGPSTTPSNLGEHLRAHGLVYEEKIIGMATDLLKLNGNIPKPEGLTVVRVSDTDTLNRWVKALKTGFSLSDAFAEAMSYVCTNFDLTDEEVNYHYLGLLNDEPVATTSLSLSNGVASIYDVSTVPKARRQGIGATLTLTALLEAREAGYRVAVLHSSHMAAKLYERLGFREYCRINRYVYDH
jgi:ribosomal protein S18 acetylase RimI-like enzyme